MFKIIVVEDDRELNRAVSAFLNQNGYEATGCLSANEAVLTRDAEEFYDCFYWIDLPKGIEWENIWYREDRVLLDDGTRLLNIGTDAHQ